MSLLYFYFGNICTQCFDWVLFLHSVQLYWHFCLSEAYEHFPTTLQIASKPFVVMVTGVIIYVNEYSSFRPVYPTQCAPVWMST